MTAIAVLSEAPSTDPSTTVVARPRLVTGPLLRVFAASFGSLCSFYLLLSVVPMVVTSSGSDGVAGLATGLLMLGGVLAELVTAPVMARIGGQRALAIGLVLLGAPALALMVSHQVVVVMAVCLVRGIGFGVTMVATGSLAVALIPSERLGEGLGLSGVVACAPGIVALPAGVWLVDHAGYAAVFALAAVTAFGGLAAQLGSRPGSAAAPDAEAAVGLLAAVRGGGQLRPALAFATMTMAAGIVVAFLPLAGVSSGAGAAALLVQAVAATVGRWAAGRYGDRHGHARLLIPGVVVAAFGMTLLAAASNSAILAAGTVLFGAGFGVTQSVTMAMMIERVAPSGYGVVSALWNLAYDLGFGVGPLVFGAVVGGIGYTVGFAVTGVLMLAALVPAMGDRREQGLRRPVAERV